MKKIFVFLVLLVGLLGLSAVAMASTITLVNPLASSGITSFTGLVTAVTNFILLVIGSLATLVFVWAGILFVTSGGNPAQITKARQALTYAIIGIFIALAGKELIAVIQAVIPGT